MNCVMKVNNGNNELIGFRFIYKAQGFTILFYKKNSLCHDN